MVAVLVLAASAVALAGQASSGELFFYPCTSCHPITDAQLSAGRQFPNGFKGHDIELEGHDKLGKGEAACLVCHEPPDKNPGKLHAIDGSLVDVNGDISRVCYRCHSSKYNEWKAGVHGRNEKKCTAAGCHDPHTPGFMWGKELMPFVGTGFQFKVLSVRAPFKPLMQPPPTPGPETPGWFALLVVFALFVVAVLIALLAAHMLQGRSDR